jgi:hypothetical protein
MQTPESENKLCTALRQPESYLVLAVAILLVVMAFDPPHKDFILNSCVNLLLFIVAGCFLLFAPQVRTRMAARQMTKTMTSQVQETPTWLFRIGGAIGMLITASHLHDLIQQWPF